MQGYTPRVVALVAVGGSGSRLAASDNRFSRGSKSLLYLAGKPAVVRTIRGLRDAGILRLHIVGDTTGCIREAKVAAFSLGYRNADITTERDFGLGAHGLPMRLLRGTHGPVLLVPGHCAARPNLYVSMLTCMRPGLMVVAKYDLKQCGDPSSRTLFPDEPAEGKRSSFVSAMPYLIDSTYAQIAKRAKYDVGQILAAYEEKSQLLGVSTTSPIEFDVAVEFDALVRDIRRRPIGRECLRRSLPSVT